MPSLDIAVFGSGRGSNFLAVLKQVEEGRIPGARICLAVSNNSKAGVLELAHTHGIPAVHLSEKQFTCREEYVGAILDTLSVHHAELIVLAGYMKIVPPQVIERYRNRIINIHPALLPRFGGHGMYGMHVHEAVLAAGERVSGATVHIVDEQYDHGTIVLQKTVPVLQTDSPETLAARVLDVEHEILPEAIRMFIEGRVPHNDAVVGHL